MTMKPRIVPLIISEREAAQALSLSPSQLRRMRKEGVGPPYRQLGIKRLGYRVTELEQWIDSQPKG